MNLGCRLIADLLVVVHFSYVGFVLVGFLVTLVGMACRWSWIRNFTFRSLHLVAIAIVVGESLCGIPCPLTVWEHQLRRAAGQVSYQGDFIAAWVHELLYFDWPTWVFTLIYSLFGLLVLLTFVLAPPRLPHWVSSVCKGRTGL